MHHQGYQNKKNKFFQDNKSEMRIEINGKNSVAHKYRHIDIIYLFLKDWMGK